jgi:hypothetical protein
MEMLDKILLGLLLGAFATFPVAVFFYLRSAYRKGGWSNVKTAAMLAAVAMLIPLVLRFWFDWEISHFLRALENPLALGSILFVALMWLAHRAMKAWAGEDHDHH